jgi:hypothetical protein
MEMGLSMSGGRSYMTIAVIMTFSLQVRGAARDRSPATERAVLIVRCDGIPGHHPGDLIQHLR